VFLIQPQEDLVKNRLARFQVAILNERNQLLDHPVQLVTTIHFDNSDRREVSAQQDRGGEISPLSGNTTVVAQSGVALFEVKPMVLTKRMHSRFLVREPFLCWSLFSLFAWLI
jgi:hypothetical protein